MTTTRSTDTIISITAAALEQVMLLRDQESIPDLHLGLRISGVGASGFVYETSFVRADDVAADDHLEMHGDLPVAIDAGSVENLRGSELDMSADPYAPGLVLRNPNPATPPILEQRDLDLTGTVEERVTQLLEHEINPAIAAHGGYVRLIALDGSTAHLEMGGGCQGCGLAAMTLRQGIETAIRQHIPEIEEIVDATNHEAGENPFYV
jgi:Fe/S biogenesis protein NfuA